MKQLPDFDLSVIMPLHKRLDEFKLIFPSKSKYYERNGIEVVIVVDELSEQEGILDYIRKYPFINWKVVVNSQDHLWGNSAKIFNVGIRQATKQYVLIMDPKLEFYTDVIYELRENLDSYPEHYAIGQVLIMDIHEEINEQMIEKYCNELVSYGGIMAKKEYFERIGGFEQFVEWDGADDNLCRRFELAGIYQLFFPEAILICKEDFSRRIASRGVQKSQIPSELLLEMLLPIEINVKRLDWGIDNDVVAYDWKKHPFAKEQCLEYLSTLKEFSISSDDIYEKSYPLIALIPTYNEAEHITDCLLSVEKYCDGIILLDDESTDNTYQISQSDKLLIKVRKVRTEFNDKQNRNILLDLASFFKAEWFIFIDADERFDDRFVDLREVMEKTDVDTVGVWIANLWDSMDTYRIMKDPYAKNGLWFRWRMFRNKGRVQIINQKKLHFPSVPYAKSNCNPYRSKTLFLHLGYLSQDKRKYKYNFYQIEDKDEILCYDDILYTHCEISYVQEIIIP